MAHSISNVFLVGTILSICAFFAVLFLPKQSRSVTGNNTDNECGEKMLMAEQTAINKRNQPDSLKG